MRYSNGINVLSILEIKCLGLLNIPLKYVCRKKQMCWKGRENIWEYDSILVLSPSLILSTIMLSIILRYSSKHKSNLTSSIEDLMAEMRSRFSYTILLHWCEKICFHFVAQYWSHCFHDQFIFSTKVNH